MWGPTGLTAVTVASFQQDKGLRRASPQGGAEWDFTRVTKPLVKILPSSPIHMCVRYCVLLAI